MQEFDKISNEQFDLTAEHMRSLTEENIDLFWNTVSKVDKARFYGMFVADGASKGTFRDYVYDVVLLGRKNQFHSYIGQSAVGSNIRFTDFGDIYVNIAHEEHKGVYNEETSVPAIPLHLTLDTDLEDGNIVQAWKVRIYADKFYEQI